MEWIFILVILFINSFFGGCQNLLINPSFEVIDETSLYNTNSREHFYCENWFEPTDGTVDILRDVSVCNDDYMSSIEYKLKTCVDVKSGNYCLGFVPLSFMGYMEHITGTFKEKLKSGRLYKISFHLKFIGSNTPFISKGIGYKVSKDSIIFKGEELFNYKDSPFYDNLFANNKVFSDFEIDEYILDTNWVKYESFYKATGGEQFITFGTFSIKDDKKIIKQFEKVRYEPYEDKIKKFIRNDKSLVCKKYFEGDSLAEDYDYYLLDDISVVEVDDNYDFIDTIPKIVEPKRKIEVDKGFVGDLEIELGVSLNYMESYVLEYGKKYKIVIVNTEERSEDKNYEYSLKYPARKLKKRPVTYYIEKINKRILDKYKNEAIEVTQINTEGFSGLIIKLNR